MGIFSVILFLLYTWSFGFSVGRFVKESDNFLEKNLMRMGIGLGVFVFLGYLFNLLRIPLDWKIFLLVAIAVPAFFLFKDYRKGISHKPEIKLSKSNVGIVIMLALFAITLFMYHTGAFAYPYLEDDDSWSHALGVKFVAVEKTVFAGVENTFHYLEPYPPAYDMLFGIMHQTNDSVYWTLKFFNALIVSLSIIFFYFFARVFTNSTKKAVFSTFALFAVPAFLSHFIWAIALTMPLIFVSFYAVEKIKDDKKWWLIAALVIIATVTSSPTHSTYFGLFFVIYYVGRVIVEKRFLLYEFLAGFAGLLLSLALWWIPMISTYGIEGTLAGVGISRGASVLSVVGTGDRIYTLSDFVFAKFTNMVNNPIGIGIVLSILTVIGFAILVTKYKHLMGSENHYRLVTILWFLFALYAVNAARFSIKLSPFRAWMILAIPVSLLSGEAIDLINNFTKGLVRNFVKSRAIVMTATFIVLGLIIYGVVMTSFIQKYTVNTTSGWPAGGFWTYVSDGSGGIASPELQGYIWFKDNIPKGSKVFTFSNDALIIGFDKFICHWCDDVIEYKKSGFNESIDQNYDWLNKGQYEYIIVDGQTASRFGAEETNNKVQELINSDKFSIVFNNEGMVIFQIL